MLLSLWLAAIDPAQWTALSGVVALFTATGVLLFRMLRSTDSITDRLEDEIKSLRSDVEQRRIENVRCERRVSMLIGALQKANIAVPDEVWSA